MDEDERLLIWASAYEQYAFDLEMERHYLENRNERIKALEEENRILKKYPFGCDNVEHFTDTIKELEDEVKRAEKKYSDWYVNDNRDLNDLESKLAKANKAIKLLRDGLKGLFEYPSPVFCDWLPFTQKENAKKRVEKAKQALTEADKLLKGE